MFPKQSETPPTGCLEIAESNDQSTLKKKTVPSSKEPNGRLHSQLVLKSIECHQAWFHAHECCGSSTRRSDSHARQRPRSGLGGTARSLSGEVFEKDLSDMLLEDR